MKYALCSCLNTEKLEFVSFHINLVSHILIFGRGVFLCFMFWIFFKQVEMSLKQEISKGNFVLNYVFLILFCIF